MTLSFNLRPGSSLGAAVKAIQQAEKEIGCRKRLRRRFPAARRNFAARLQERAVSDPGGDRRHLHRAGRALRKLHSSDHDSFFAAFGWRGRIAGAADLAVMDLSLIALIGIILLIGIVKKNAIMMIDFALEAEREEELPPEQSIYQGVPAAVPADHDDHHGGAARSAAAGTGARHRVGIAEAARHLDCGRFVAVAIPYALHDAGHLSLSGPLWPLGSWLARPAGLPDVGAAETCQAVE